jgi:hypothetical protein
MGAEQSATSMEARQIKPRHGTEACCCKGLIFLSCLWRCDLGRERGTAPYLDISKSGAPGFDCLPASLVRLPDAGMRAGLPEHESDRAPKRTFDSHLSRAKSMTEHGHPHLLRGGASA